MNEGNELEKNFLNKEDYILEESNTNENQFEIKNEAQPSQDINESIKYANKIYLEMEKKKEEKRKRKAKLKKVSLRFLTTASCFAFLGAGIGAGGIIAKNVLIKYEKDNFKFDTESTGGIKQDIQLTSNDIAAVFEEVGDSVVNISALVAQRNMFSGTTSGSGIIYKIEGDTVYIITNNHVIENTATITISITGEEQVQASLVGADSGSGIIYKIEGDTVYIITNNHVIENTATITISITGEEQVQASLVGADPSSDLAVLKTSKKALEQAGIKNVTVAKFADSDQVKVGEFVFPIGNALGRGKTITQGIISAQNKEINIDGKKLTVLQTDAAINPGNSGGALINSSGEVVGINTAKLSSSAIEGIGYAIPTNIAIKVVEDIIQNGSVQKPYLGVQGETITPEIKMIFNLNTDGVIITNVEQGSNADIAGIIPTDIIVSFDGKKIRTLEELSDAIKSVQGNKNVKVGIVRNGYQEMTIDVMLTQKK